jgi:alkanesulfonate monooxygenase SsuD/methylene tetrahydromethanopterin reductase-like flavin-dependent oxidoreductase (luciferase family)
VKVGVLIPAGDTDGPGGLPSFDDALAFARAAESGGLDSAWLADHFFYRDADGAVFGLHEAWTWLAGIAAGTTRLELGHLVVCTSFRPPALTAKMAVTLDAISNGRFILGLGCGWHEAEYDAMGLPFDHRVGRFEEALAIIAGLLRGEEVTLHGQWYEAERAVMAPRPARRIPILVAARRDRMLDLTARHADAWNTAWYGAPDDRLATMLEAFEAALAGAGRSRADCEVTVGINVRDDDQPPPPEPDPKALGGSVEELADVLARYEELGVAHVMAVLEPMTIPSVERLAKAVALQRSRRPASG